MISAQAIIDEIESLALAYRMGEQVMAQGQLLISKKKRKGKIVIEEKEETIPFTHFLPLEYIEDIFMDESLLEIYVKYKDNSKNYDKIKFNNCKNMIFALDKIKNELRKIA